MNSMTNKYSGNRIAALLLMAMSLALSTSVSAAEPTADGEHDSECQHGSSGDPDGMQMLERMREEMGLSDDQMQQLGSLSEMYRPRFTELAQRGTETRQALLTMAPDDPAYNSTASEMSQRGRSNVPKWKRKKPQWKNAAKRATVRDTNAKPAHGSSKMTRTRPPNNNLTG